MATYLSIESLSVSYGTARVLDRVSLGVERGEMIALLGSSGCGKTTLLRAIAGFVSPCEGTIRSAARTSHGCRRKNAERR
jgi:ABC-type Fe3+/spermidine/putrescine transport system ATPase subunit